MSPLRVSLAYSSKALRGRFDGASDEGECARESPLVPLPLALLPLGVLCVAPAPALCEKASELGDTDAFAPAFVAKADMLPRPGSILARNEGLRWPRFVLRGFSLGCEASWLNSCFTLLRMEVETGQCGGRDHLRTVGGGLGLPSESSTFVLVRFANCSSRKARSRRSFSMPRCMRARRTEAAVLASSTSFMRCLSWIHFLRYDSSTEGGSVGGIAV